MGGGCPLSRKAGLFSLRTSIIKSIIRFGQTKGATRKGKSNMVGNKNPGGVDYGGSRVLTTALFYRVLYSFATTGT